MRLLVDYETRSQQPIKTGAWKYATHPSTEVMCAAYSWKVDGKWSPTHVHINVWGDDEAHLRNELAAKGVIISPRGHFITAMNAAAVRVAHNVEFEQAVTSGQFPEIEEPTGRWSCTMARGSRLSLPLKLEGLMIAIGGPDKDMEGNRLMKQVSKPRPKWKKDGTGEKWFQDTARLCRVYEYAASDVASEIFADDLLPELDAFETACWQQIMKENIAGLQIDTQLLEASSRIVAWRADTLQAEVAQETKGAIVNINSRDQVLNYLKSCGVDLPDLTAQTVEQTLTQVMHTSARRVLLLKSEAAKSSNSKLKAFAERLFPDNRARDFQVYHGAHTGRTTGRGPQPLNLPRPGDVDVAKARPAILSLDVEAVKNSTSADALKRVPGENAGVKNIRPGRTQVTPAEAISACLRTLIVPKEGNVFVAADYSGVEMVGLMTVAGQEDALVAIRDKEDLYCNLATGIYGFEVLKKQHPEERQLGKQGILGCGYGLRNPETFMGTCESYGMIIQSELAERVISTYAEKMYMVPKLWDGVNDGAIRAMQNPGGIFGYNGINFKFDGSYWLKMQIPSGSVIYYPGATLIKKWNRPNIQYNTWVMGAWRTTTTYGGKLVENAIQKMCRMILEQHKMELIRRGLEVRFTIYDEIVFDVPLHQVEWAKQQISEVMDVAPSWLPNMPLSAEPVIMEYFQKD